MRNDEYRFTKPILFVDYDESEDLERIKKLITGFVDSKYSEGAINSTSVFFMDLKSSKWFTINRKEYYSPGSLMKVPTLISYLKQSESDPALMEREIFFKSHFSSIPEQQLTGPQLVEGKNYKVKELLKYMIAYSDNDATALLNMNINFATMQKMFMSLQLPVPSIRQPDYLLNVEDYSRFFLALYNGSYLSVANSEFALELLTKSTYNQGLSYGLDSNMVIAHKFGERNNDGEQQLHEFGIFYLDNDVYLLGVMTKGADRMKLPGVISGVSQIIFKEVTGYSKGS